MKSALMLGVNPQAKREDNDFYATDPKALKLLLRKLEEDKVFLNKNIWECSCGMGHLSKELEKNGYSVLSTDLIDRGFGKGNIDFLQQKTFPTIFDKGDILTNPPFKLAEEFVEKGMELLKENSKLILFLKIQFLEGQKRKILFEKYPLKYVYCHSSRQLCCKDGEFEKYTATTQFYAWFIWEKGFIGKTRLNWI